MLRMTVEGVGFDHKQNTVVVLKDWEGNKLLPIWIGPNEARAIALELENARPQRPLSHDLLLQCVELTGGRVSRVVINDLQEQTFYATIDVDTGTGMHHIDARPSDAIALAVRAKCPVFVDGDALKALVDLKDVHPIEGGYEMRSDIAAALPAEPISGGDASSETQESEIARFKRLIGELDLQE